MTTMLILAVLSPVTITSIAVFVGVTIGRVGRDRPRQRR